MISGAAAAALVELDPAPQEDRAALFAALAQAGGSASGPIIAGMLAEWAPKPLVLPVRRCSRSSAWWRRSRRWRSRSRAAWCRGGCGSCARTSRREIRVLFARVSVTGRGGLGGRRALPVRRARPTPPTCSTPRTWRCSGAVSARDCWPRPASRRSPPAARTRTPACRPSGLVLLALGLLALVLAFPARSLLVLLARGPADRHRPRDRLPRRPGAAQPRRPARPPRRGQRGLLHADLPRRRDLRHLHRPAHARVRALDRGTGRFARRRSPRSPWRPRRGTSDSQARGGRRGRPGRRR